MTGDRNPRLRAVLFGLFAVSGFSGLIYESIWCQYLKLILGHAAYAQTLVLAIFMGGMALGAWLASRHSERWRNPLLAYALIEAAVGLMALAFHPVFVATLDLLHGSWIPALESPASITLLKWIVAAALILLQSILLGTTFPLMSAAIIRLEPKRAGATLGMVYFSNSIGAAVGVLVSGFWLIQWKGLPGTIVFAGILNLLLAAVVLWLGRGRTDAALAPRDQATSATARAPSLILAAALLTGAASFFYEIGWIRMLNLVLGTTNQAFELMLSAFITGLALGSLWIRRRLDRIASLERYAGHVQLLMGIFALATILLYSKSFDLMAYLLQNLEKNDFGYALFHLGSHGIALAVMLPATFMAGMTLPLFTQTLLRRGLGERVIGRVYAANTVGAILGVLAATHLVMPALGAKGLIISGAGIDIVLGLCLLAAGGLRLRRWDLVAGAATAGLVLAWVAFGVHLDPRKLASGVYRFGVASLEQDHEVIFHRDGKTATVHLIRTRGELLSLTTNGKPDASVRIVGPGFSSDELTMVMTGALPLALRPEAQDVANIGLGCGMTTHTLLASEKIRRVDTIEIEAAVVEAARNFGDFVARAYLDPRSFIHVEDAKTFLSSRKELYDVIVSEPSNPWVSGVPSLFSEEFYRDIMRHLRQGGLLVQWLQLYETNLEVVASVIKALSKHFSDFAIYNADDSNVIVVAAEGGNVDKVDPWIFGHPLLARELQRVGLREPSDLRIRRLGSASLLRPLLFSYEAPANSDYYPYLSYQAPKSRYLQESAAALSYLHSCALPVLEMLDPLAEAASSQITTSPHFVLSRYSQAASQMVDNLLARRQASAQQFGPVYQEALRQIILHLETSDGRVLEQKVLIEALLMLATITTPYVEGSRLEAMWAALAERPRHAAVERAARRWFTLYRAVAARDADSMTRLAGELLASGASGSNQKVLEFLLATGLCGRLARGERVAARAFYGQWKYLYSQSPDPPLYLKLLVAQLEVG